MTILEWPGKLPKPDRAALRAELTDLIDQIVNEEIHALDTLDDQFARMAAALLALLDSPTDHTEQCAIVDTIHQYLKQPLTLMWWHQFRKRGEPMHIDAVGAWINNSQTPHWWDNAPSANAAP